MTLIDRYIIRQTLVPSLLALAITSFVGVANELRERISELPIEYITVGDFANLMLLFLPALVSYIVPITFLFGILMAFGQLSAQGEIAAMTTSGIPLKRVVAPVLLTGAVLSLACFMIQDRLQPWAMARVNRLMYEELPLRATLDVLSPGVMHDFRGWKVYHAGRDPETGVLRNVELLMPESNGQATLYFAREAELIRAPGGSTLEMRHGHIILPESEGRIGRITFEKQSLPLPAFAPKPTRMGWWVKPLGTLLTMNHELEEKVARSQSPRDPDRLRKVREEISVRLALPLACFAVGCIAAPLGARARGGGRSYTFSAGLAACLGYYLLWMLLQPRSLNPLPEVVLRALAPDLVFCGVGAWFIWRLDRV